MLAIVNEASMNVAAAQTAMVMSLGSVVDGLNSKMQATLAAFQEAQQKALADLQEAHSTAIGAFELQQAAIFASLDEARHNTIKKLMDLSEDGTKSFTEVFNDQNKIAVKAGLQASTAVMDLAHFVQHGFPKPMPKMPDEGPSIQSLIDEAAAKLPVEDPVVEASESEPLLKRAAQ